MFALIVVQSMASVTLNFYPNTVVPLSSPSPSPSSSSYSTPFASICSFQISSKHSAFCSFRSQSIHRPIVKASTSVVDSPSTPGSQGGKKKLLLEVKDLFAVISESKQEILQGVNLTVYEGEVSHLIN